MKASTIKEKKALLEVIEGLYKRLEEDRDYVSMDYKPIKETDKQAVDWKTKEPKFNDDGTPVYEWDWGYVEKEELTDDDKAKIKAYDTIMAALEKMI